MGENVATQKAAVQETLMAEQFPEAVPLLLPDFPQCIASLQVGDCAAVMIDTISAEQFMETVDGLASATSPWRSTPRRAATPWPS